MYIWKLARVNDWPLKSDTLRSIVVIAETDPGARLLAAESCGDEGRKLWLDADRASCNAIGEALDHMATMPTVVCTDYLEP